MKIAIGSTNKAKTGAVEAIVNQYINGVEFIHLSVDSGVSEQPMTDQETRLGAMNRAKHALLETNADFAFGLEGGVREIDAQLYICNWAALATSTGQLYTAAGAQIPLPEEVASELLKGRELGPVMNEFTAKKDIRQNEGAVGIFTAGLVDRKSMFEHVIRLIFGQYLYATQVIHGTD